MGIDAALPCGMAYPPRRFEPDLIYFITSRTSDGCFFLRPSWAVNNVIGSVLADAQERFEVELFDYVFLSNHMHLAARSRSGRLPEFMQYLKANIALGINRMLGRRGHLWEMRYAASPILDEGAQLERAVYIYGHGVKEGLVERADRWPGVASLKERLGGVSPGYQRVDQSGLTRHRAGRRARPKPGAYRRPVSVRLSPWPFLEGLSRGQARRQVRELAAAARERAHPGRSGRRFLGVKHVLAQDPWTRPERPPRRKPTPLCHARSPERRRAYAAAFRLFMSDYSEASQRFRAGELSVSFPRYSHPPPLPLGWTDRSRAGPA